MINIIQTIKQKYYTYIPGEFMPVRVDGVLTNTKDFHIYKAKRAIWMVRNYRLVIHAATHQRG